MEGCPKPSISVLKNNIFHCGQGCLKPVFKNEKSHFSLRARTNLGVPLLLGSLLKLLKPFGGSWRLLGASWAVLALLVETGGVRKTIASSIKKNMTLMVRPLARGPFGTGGLPLAGFGVLGREAGSMGGPLGSRDPSRQGQRAPGRGGPNLSKGGLGAGHPLAEY